MSNSIFSSSKKDFNTWVTYLTLMTFNVPLEMTEEFYKTNTHDKEYLENMTLINNMCSWLKRYIYRFIGMRMANLQSYLNWFVYLFRVKGAVEQWPKMDRIL